MTETKEIPLIDLDISNLPKPWTLKQAKFALALLADPKRHAGKAAREAGFTERSADAQASRMLNDDKFKHIPEYINAREKKVVNKYAYDHEKHVEQLVKQATFNIMDFYKPDPVTGELKIDWREVPYELGSVIDAISTKQLSIKTVEGGEEISLPVLETGVKFTDRTKAQDMLNRIMSSYRDKVEHTGVLAVKIVDDVEGE